MKIRHLLYGILAVGALTLQSCDDFLDIQPIGKVIPKTGAEYRALLTKAYDDVPEDRGLATFRSDEMKMDGASSEDYNAYFDIWSWNDDAPQETTSSFSWRTFYHTIYVANYIIEHQDKITEASTEEIRQLVGESYMLRAYMHFILVNLYGAPYTHCDPATTLAVPLKLDTDVDAVLKKATVGQIYEQINRDIDQAENYLNVEKWEAGKTYRFNKLSAQALRARVALYMGNWQGALDASKQVLQQQDTLVNLNNTKVLPNHYQSPEAIVSLEQVMTSNYFNAGNPSAELLAKYRTGDLRKSKYYKQITASTTKLVKGGSNEYRCTFRTADFYLIAAEAWNELNRPDSAKVYLEALMSKRYTPAQFTVQQEALRQMDQTALRGEIADERLRELAFEGHRWFDLRRTGRPALTKTHNGTAYTLEAGDSRYTLRIPSEAVAANPELGKEQAQTVLTTQ